MRRQNGHFGCAHLTYASYHQEVTKITIVQQNHGEQWQTKAQKTVSGKTRMLFSSQIYAGQVSSSTKSLKVPQVVGHFRPI